MPGSAMSPYLTTSPSPSVRTRGGSVARVSTAQATATGWWNAPTRFLPGAEVDAGLAADGRVDLGEQRGRDLEDGDAAVPGGGEEPGEVADHAPADGDDEVAAGERQLGAHLPQLARGSPAVLGDLAVADEVADDLEAGRRRGAASTASRWPAATTGSWVTTSAVAADASGSSTSPSASVEVSRPTTTG